MTTVEIKFAINTQAESFVNWIEVSDGFEKFGIMIAQRPSISRTVVTVFSNRSRAQKFAFWFAYEGGLEIFNAHLLESDASKAFLLDKVESLDVNKNGLRLSIR